jgi:hypothetical protein
MEYFFSNKFIFKLSYDILIVLVPCIYQILIWWGFKLFNALKWWNFQFVKLKSDYFFRCFEPKYWLLTHLWLFPGSNIRYIRVILQFLVIKNKGLSWSKLKDCSPVMFISFIIRLESKIKNTLEVNQCSWIVIVCNSFFYIKVFQEINWSIMMELLFLERLIGK